RALSASSATLELDRLMASLSDFNKQNTVSPRGSATNRCRASDAKLCNHQQVQLVQPETEAPCGPKCSEAVPSPSGSEAVPGLRGDLDSMLVQLQSGLKLQGIETQSKGQCESCQKPIAGQ
ncbi:hypothetical protein FKM82_029745, partial [Ascaphus truei]